MCNFCVSEQGTELKFGRGQLIVEKDGKKLQSLPIEMVDSIEVFGNINITKPLMDKALSMGILISLYSYMGYFYGNITPSNEKCYYREQITALDNKEFCVALAQKIVNAKIKNQLVLLNRNDNKNICKSESSGMKYLAGLSEKEYDLQKLLGYEGAAAKLYFNGLSKIVRDEFKFSGRSKRPPKDEFNAMLGFGYTLLENEIGNKIEAEGISKNYGVIHKYRVGLPALSSDLIEEWRAVIVDSVVLGLVNRGTVNKTGFDVSDDAVFMDNETKKIFLSEYHTKLNSEMCYLGKKMTYRQALRFQAVNIRKAFCTQDAELYEPVRIR